MYCLGLDVSYRTGWSLIDVLADGQIWYEAGGTLPNDCTVQNRLDAFRWVREKTGPALSVSIEQPIPAGNRMYTIEAAKRLGEMRAACQLLGVEWYSEVHPVHMRSFVLNAKFKGKDAIEAFVNAYFKGRFKSGEKILAGDEADSAAHALIVAGVRGFIRFPEPWRQSIIEKIRNRPQQPLA